MDTTTPAPSPIERTVTQYDGAEVLGWTWDGRSALIRWGDALTVASVHSTTLGRWESRAEALDHHSDTFRSRFRHWGPTRPTVAESADHADAIAAEVLTQARMHPHGDPARSMGVRLSDEMSARARDIRAGRDRQVCR
jgi:hypothetical protein